MADVPGDASTTATVTVGSTTAGTLEVVGDHDWFRITLTAGQSITVTINGITLEDPYLYIRDSGGNLLYENDDISSGIIRDSELAFTANYTGTYYIDVGAWDENYVGDYQIVVQPYIPPPLASLDQIADQLTSGYWGGDSHHFNAVPGGTITVNLTALTAAGQNLAREALALWTDILGINFAEVASGGQIVFDDNEEGAFSDGIWSNGVISSARINVSTEWLATYGTSLNSYAFQAYIHEIGHALGLGHAGNYNETARYPYDAEFQNDSWATSVMSYFSQTENTYFAGRGFTENIVVTPMLADILAITTLYGSSTTTRTGNTTYGFNSNAGRAVFNASLHPSVSYTIFDSGGVDTLDYSGFSGTQLINLNPESFSNIGNRVGNVSIARGVVIENAIGGSGADTIIGNGVDNILSGGSGADTLTGGAGSDTFQDTTANLNGDTITDFSAGDRIVFTNASLAAFTFSLTGSTLTFSGGSLTLQGGVAGTLTAAAAAGGGVQLTIGQAIANDARNDFNGDGRSDVLWRNVDGTLTDWLGTAQGGFTANTGNALVSVPVTWQVVGTGDFNGDGRDDILWRNSDGTLTDWLGRANGGFVSNHENASFVLAAVWQVVGTGDFNGDGRDDILWRNQDGTVTDWLGTANGSFVANAVNAWLSVPASWHVVGIGDFNGDGRDDVLWRNTDGTVTDWLGRANGGFVSNHENVLTGVPADWHVVGTGDFNGDGKDDILWRNDSGTLTDWLGRANGGFVSNHENALFATDLGWNVAGIGDYNGDGRDDVLWRSTSGGVTNWFGQANGSFFSGGDPYNLANSWQVQPNPAGLGLWDY